MKNNLVTLPWLIRIRDYCGRTIKSHCWLVALFASAALAHDRKCPDLESENTLEELYRVLIEQYEEFSSKYSHMSIDKLVTVTVPPNEAYMFARYAAYRILIDPHGYRGTLKRAFIDAEAKGFTDGFTRFIDLAHGRLTYVLMKQNAVGDKPTEKLVDQTLEEVVQILTTPQLK